MKPNRTIAGWLILSALLTLNLQLSSAFAQNGAWTEKVPMPTARFALGVGVVNGILYTVGGQECDGPRLATVESYNPVTDTWATDASLSLARANFGVGVINGILYAAGGWVYDYDDNTASVEAYDPTSNTWSQMTPMPDSRANLGVGVIQGILYAVGGGQSHSAFSTVWAYDPVANTWTTKAPMPTARAGLGVGVVNGILYAVGGDTTGNGDFCTANEAYDPVSNSWTEKAPLPAASYETGMVVGLNGLLYVQCDGQNGTSPTTLYAYNPATDSWTTNAPMPTSRTSEGLGVVNGSIFAVGGYSTSCITTNEAFTPNLLAINMYAGLTICGQIGNTYEIDYCNNLAVSNWTALTTMVLSNSPCLYIDTNSTWFSHRFYRAMPQ